MQWSGLSKISSDHYRRTRHLLRDVLYQLLTANTGTRSLRVMDVGSGELSILLSSVLSLDGLPDGYDRSIEIFFVDRKPLSEVKPVTFPEDTDTHLHDFTCHWRDGTTCDAETSPIGIPVECHCIERDFTEILSDNGFPGEIDLLVMNAVLHELCIEDLHVPAEFLQWLFDHTARQMNETGVLFIGDGYYPPYLDGEQVSRYLQAMRDHARHADPPAGFVHPEELLTVLVRMGEAQGLRTFTLYRFLVWRRAYLGLQC